MAAACNLINKSTIVCSAQNLASSSKPIDLPSNRKPKAGYLNQPQQTIEDEDSHGLNASSEGGVLLHAMGDGIGVDGRSTVGESLSEAGEGASLLNNSGCKCSHLSASVLMGTR